MITSDTIDKIMDATRIEEVIGEFVSLKKRGVNLIGLCPFHNEKTPSFNASVPKGIYKCFGCGKGGNAVNFLMEHEHYTYPEALRYLAAKYSIDIVEEKPSPEQQEAIDEKESLFNLSAFAQKFFKTQLHETEEGKAVGLSYLKERGYSAEMVKKFGLGYCPDKWDTFSQNALRNGYKKEYLLKTSLSKQKDQLLFDTFRGRIIFPIHNLSGRVLGFGARIMTSDKKRPKYINSAESDIYHKSKVLYGLYFAKSAVASKDNCFLVEGYTDVISLHQAGITNVIATSGTALSVEQIKLIRRYTSNVTLLFDGDPAGIKAAFRSTDMILEEGLNVRIVLFPDGEDPDSYASKYRPAEVQEFIDKQATDFISFKTKLLLDEAQDDPIKKAALIREIAQTVSLIPEPITRSLFIKKCSTMMEVEENMLVAEVGRLRRQRFLKRNQKGGDTSELPEPPVTIDSQKQAEEPDTNEVSEKELVRLLLNYGNRDMVFEIESEDKRLEELQVKVVDFIIRDIQEDQLRFENEECQAIFNVFEKAWQNQQLPDDKVFTEHPDPNIQKLSIDLQSNQYNLSTNWEHRHRIYVLTEEENLKPAVLHAVYDFKLKKLEKMIKEMQDKLKETHLTTSEEGKEKETITLLETLNNLIIKRKQFAAELQRVVTR